MKVSSDEVSIQKTQDTRLILPRNKGSGNTEMNDLQVFVAYLLKYRNTQKAN